MEGEWKEINFDGLSDEAYQAYMKQISDGIAHAMEAEGTAPRYGPSGIININREIMLAHACEAWLTMKTGFSPLPEEQPVGPLLFVEVYPCSSCDGDYHADWTCPSCGHKNIVGYWDVAPDQYCLPVDEVTDTCEKKDCKLTVRLHQIIDEPCFVGQIEAKPEECNCEFDPAPEGEDPELHYHYRRTCPSCKQETLSLHCEHDGIQGDCAHCGKRLPSSRTTEA